MSLTVGSAYVTTLTINIRGERKMDKTGVFATAEELQDLTNLANRGWRDGDVVIVTSIMEGIRKDDATIDARKACHKLALAHGLPEIDGYYGINTKGEFVNF